MKILLLLLLFITHFYFTIEMKSDCPPGSEPWTTGTVYYYGNYFGHEATVESKHSTVGGEIQVIIDWSTMTSNSTFIPTSAMKKILEMRAVQDAVPSNPDNSYSVKVFFETECKVKIKTVLEMDKSYEPCCAEGMDISEQIYEHYDGLETYKLYNIYQTKNCGYNCCYRLYNVNVVYNTLPPYGIQKLVSNPTSHTLPPICDPNSDYIDCFTELPIPCISGDCE
jgi:hypothetical protein